MSVASLVKAEISKVEEGSLFTYQLFSALDNQQAVALTLSRLCKQGIIRRLRKGSYYKPRKTQFGALGPTETEIISNLLTATRYISDIAAFNSLGLTTQVPSEITIKGDTTPRIVQYGNVRVRFQKSDAEVSPANVIYLQILDALKEIKGIPDSEVSTVFERVRKLILAFSYEDQKVICRLAQSYQPSVRAMVGAIIQNSSLELASALKSSLNPLTSYKIGISEKVLSNRSEWRIF